MGTCQQAGLHCISGSSHCVSSNRFPVTIDRHAHMGQHASPEPPAQRPLWLMSCPSSHHQGARKLHLQLIHSQQAAPPPPPFACFLPPQDEAARKFHLPADMGQWDGEGKGALSAVRGQAACGQHCRSGGSGSSRRMVASTGRAGVTASGAGLVVQLPTLGS